LAGRTVAHQPPWLNAHMMRKTANMTCQPKARRNRDSTDA
jgi:hypothetical protein